MKRRRNDHDRWQWLMNDETLYRWWCLDGMRKYVR